LIFPFFASLGLIACRTTTKEPSHAASSAPNSPQAPQYEMESAQTSPPSSDESAPSEPTHLGNAPGDSVAAARDDASSKTDLRRGVNGTGATDTTAGAKPKKSMSSARKEADSTARPAAAVPAAAPQMAFAEPPQLHAAIVEFDTAFEQLSTSHACEDACRAFASMRRAADRICDLVISNDPRERCRNARSRLEGAAKDLAPKCTCS
jgi:hypothetical protein